ncbi:hypothetical protein SMD44_05108 [Streptomyces alboflavus]|uniref:Uncharacterized protein n=1 Tax=Streptomyces alboflavus TaxID=67267 RepID=A0A1Z1WGR9_9ACTN|nr:hypothetical protein [Streptomyces alboflavus]ARX85644.1 hypothetical protein SMD44_05108 [Streptomyces alboflavus]
MRHDVEFFPVLVTAYPTDEDHAPLLVDPAAARIVRAGDIVDGDTVLASIGHAGNALLRSDYFNDQYEAHPTPFNRACQCGVCCHLTDEQGPVIVLTTTAWGSGWCDPWPASDLALIVPANRLA